MLVIVSELFNMLDAGDLLFISLTPVWCGGLTASYTAFTAHPPAVFSNTLHISPFYLLPLLSFHTALQLL